MSDLRLSFDLGGSHPDYQQISDFIFQQFVEDLGRMVRPSRRLHES